MTEINVEILAYITAELAKAKVKFPEWPTDPIHAAAIVAEESGELTRAALQFEYQHGNRVAMFDEAIQTAAMAIRFLENYHEYSKSPQLPF